jgi:hypothetical protein
MKLVAMGVLTTVLSAGCALDTGGSTDNTPGGESAVLGSGESQNPTGTTSGSPQSRLAALNSGAAFTPDNAGTTSQPQPCPWDPVAGALAGIIGSGGDPSAPPTGNGGGSAGNGTGAMIDTPRNLAGHLSPKNRP